MTTGKAKIMAGMDNGPVADADPADDDAARRAAEVAVELTEADDPDDKPRIARVLSAAASRGAEAARRGGAVARRGGDAARHGADTATGTVVKRPGRARRGAGSAGRGVSSGASWLAGQVVAMGPRLKIRDQGTLRAQFPGRSDEDIADLLIERAARATAAVGGATGASAALPVLPAFPFEIAAETLAVVGIEIKLVAELHEIYGVPATGSGTERARAYIGSWASRRGVYKVDGGLLLVAGSPLARQLVRRLAARARRSVFSLSPLLTGAAAGALLNRRETRRFGRQIRTELRDHRAAVSD